MGQVDLLTVVAHEMGHLLGYPHSPVGNDVMAETLSMNTRRLPGLDEVACAIVRLSDADDAPYCL